MAEIKQINVGGELYDLVARSNRNLLDNWDFRNPVNQRGLTSYVASGTSYMYTIDRWRAYNSTVNVVDGALSVTASDTNDGYKRINQIIDRPLKAGTTVTASCAISQATVTHRLLFRLVDGSTGIASIQVPNISEPTILTVTFKLTADLSSPGVEFLSYNSLDEGWSITITAAKLEIGTVSTLENDPPMDYGTELAKCQRYFYSTGNANMAFIGDVGADAQNIRVTILLPTEMRSDAPTTVLTSSKSYVVTSSITKSVAATLSVASTKRIGNSLFVTLTPLSEPLVNTTAYTLCLFQSAFTVSADL